MTIVVGFSPGKDDRSAIELAVVLARSARTDVLAVSVVPAPWPTPAAGGTDREYAAWSRAEGQRAVVAATELLEEFGPDVASRAVAEPGRSVPATLLQQAEKIDAGLLVIGSSADGAWGTVVVGSTGHHLLHSSTIPVALATRGYRAAVGDRVTRATCAFRGDDASHVALARAAEICRETGSALRVATFGVVGKTMYPPEVRGEHEVLDAYVERSVASQQAAIAELPDPAAVESEVATGRDWPEALGRLVWDDGDVLVVGSSAAGLLTRVFLGSNATRIVRHAPVPVIVVP